MSIIRVSKDKKHPYLVMNKTGLDDKRLSNKSKGLLACLLSKPDNFYINYHNLISLSSDNVHSITTSIKELINFGYITKTQVRKDNGRYGFYYYTVYEVPQLPFHIKNKSIPKSGKPISVKPNSGNRSTILYNKEKIYKRATTSLSNKLSSLSKAADVPSWSDKETEAIRILNELKIFNCTKLFDLFDLPVILKYANWIRERKIKIHNPTGFLIAAIRESWDTSEPISYSSKLQSFTKKCILCDKEFTFEDYGDFHPFCPSCTYKE